MRPQLAVAVIMVSLHRRFLDGSVHSLDLAVPRENSPPDCFLILQTPWVVWLAQPVLDLARPLSSDQWWTWPRPRRSCRSASAENTGCCDCQAGRRIGCRSPLGSDQWRLQWLARSGSCGCDMMRRPVDWTCRVFVPPPVLVSATFRSKATGLFHPRAECRRRGL